MVKLPRVKAGDAVSATDFNALIDAANSCKVSVGTGSGLVIVSGPNGDSMSTTLTSFLWAKTTGAISGGTYPFTQQIPATGGTWTDGTFTGTAYEVNGNTSVTTGTKIKLWRSAAGNWLFNASAC